MVLSDWATGHCTLGHCTIEGGGKCQSFPPLMPTIVKILIWSLLLLLHISFFSYLPHDPVQPCMTPCDPVWSCPVMHNLVQLHSCSSPVHMLFFVWPVPHDDDKGMTEVGG